MTKSTRQSQAAYLLIDISNSYTKFAHASNSRLLRTMRIPTGKLTVAHIKRALKQRAVTKIVICSVVPQRNILVKRGAGKTPVTFVDPKTELGVGIDYPNPRSIGADRLANAAAVAELYGCPSIVVDFGTAVTFDVISTQRAYIGGVIAPGLDAMTNYLYQRTALLPKLTLSEPHHAIGKSTRAAMMSGAIFGYRGLVREILAQIRREAFGRRRPMIVATGGYAQLIAARVPMITAIHPHLTLEGLRIIGNLNA
jgi:type III pantothenate kinase